MPSTTLDGHGIVYRLSDGERISEGTVITDPLPEGLALLERAEAIDPSTERWDNASHAVVAYTDHDQIAEQERIVAAANAELARLRGRA